MGFSRRSNKTRWGPHPRPDGRGRSHRFRAPGRCQRWKALHRRARTARKIVAGMKERFLWYQDVVEGTSADGYARATLTQERTDQFAQSRQMTCSHPNRLYPQRDLPGAAESRTNASRSTQVTNGGDRPVQVNAPLTCH